MSVCLSLKDAVISIDRSEALRYMGYRGSMSRPVAEHLDECEKRVLEALQPMAVYQYFPLAELDCSLLKGEDINAQLYGCTGAVLMAATVGAKIDALIRTLQVEDMAKAVIADALSGAAVEQVCAEAEKHICSALSGRYLTWRFSPGYGDYSLEASVRLIKMLEADKKIGVCVSESLMLTPVKSVTAVIGVSEDQLPKKRRGCAVCSMRESCDFRKRGSHCGFQ